MKTSHTPGPWNSIFKANKERAVRDEGGIICSLRKPSRYPGQDERYENELEEYKANAKLIAAAPELLESAIKMVEMFEELCKKINWSDSFLDANSIQQMNEAPPKLKAAIKKATL